MAYIMCQNFTDDQLKAPASAEYQPYPDMKESIENLGNETYSMKYYVDAQNSYGAMIRNSFYCEIRHGEDDLWYIEDLRILD